MSNNGNIGRVIISFDFEIGWGDITNDRWRARQKLGVFDEIRIVLRQLLTQMDSLDLPVTFATVGAMFDDPEKRTLEHLPDDAKLIAHGALNDGDQQTFDGRDLFEMVLNSTSKHDIACHSYSHIPFDYKGVNAEFISQDLSEFERVLNHTCSQTADRFVFPENTEGFHEQLKAAGYKIARTGANNSHSSRIAYLASQFISPPPVSTEEVTSSGLIRQSGSMLYNSGRGKDYRVPIVYRRAKRGIDHVANHGGTLHIWAHPFNFAESEKLKLSLIKLMRYMITLRDMGKIEISPM